MSEQKMREALEKIANLDYTTPPNVGWALARATEIAREALAQQPAAVVELTDDEITAVLGKSAGLTATKIIRAVIAAHIAKQQEKGHAK